MTAEMPETGKIDRRFFEEVISQRLGASRPDVTKGPAHGVDFGVIDAGGTAVAIATDPFSILPNLGYAESGRFAIRVILADVAVSGLFPSHIALSFALPPEMTDEQFSEVWRAIDDECRDLGVSIVTGHTARYEGCTFPWVGNGAALAVGDPDEIIYPDGAQPGDVLLVTNGPAVESVGLLTRLFPEQIALDDETLERAQACLEQTGAVRDAMAVAATGGVTAMHDATEGGLFGAFHEMANSAGVELRIDTDSIPIDQSVREAADELEMDPWRATSAGTLLVAVDAGHADAVLDTLEARGTPAGIAGQVREGDGVVVDGQRTETPSGDSSWAVYERLLNQDSES